MKLILDSPMISDDPLELLWIFTVQTGDVIMNLIRLIALDNSYPSYCNDPLDCGPVSLKFPSRSVQAQHADLCSASLIFYTFCSTNRLGPFHPVFYQFGQCFSLVFNLNHIIILSLYDPV